MTRIEILKKVMKMAWQFVKRNGFSLSEGLKTAWRNIKLKVLMSERIVKFYFQKVDGTMREAYGTLSDKFTPAVGESNRKKNDTLQTYYDCEKQEWRCFKLANLAKVVY